MENTIGTGSKYEATGMKCTHVDPQSPKILEGRLSVVLVPTLVGVYAIRRESSRRSAWQLKSQKTKVSVGMKST